MGKRICFFGVMKEDVLMHLAKLSELAGKTAILVDKSKNGILYGTLCGNDLFDEEEFGSGRIYNNGIPVVKAFSNYNSLENEYDLVLEFYGFSSGYSVYDKVVYIVENTPASLRNVMSELNRWDNRERVALLLRDTFFTISEQNYVASLLNVSKDNLFSAHFQEADSQLRKRIGYNRSYRLKKLPAETKDMICALGEYVEIGEYAKLKKLIKKEGKKQWGKSLSSGRHQEEAVA